MSFCTADSVPVVGKHRTNLAADVKGHLGSYEVHQLLATNVPLIIFDVETFGDRAEVSSAEVLQFLEDRL
jgi:hypothetical protein